MINKGYLGLVHAGRGSKLEIAVRKKQNEKSKTNKTPPQNNPKPENTKDEV